MLCMFWATIVKVFWFKFKIALIISELDFYGLVWKSRKSLKEVAMSTRRTLRLIFRCCSSFADSQILTRIPIPIPPTILLLPFIDAHGDGDGGEQKEGGYDESGRHNSTVLVYKRACIERSCTCTFKYMMRRGLECCCQSFPAKRILSLSLSLSHLFKFPGEHFMGYTRKQAYVCLYSVDDYDVSLQLFLSTNKTLPTN